MKTKIKLSPTNIDWTDYVWNPMSGCTKLSEGCANCYAADMAKRLQRIQETTGKDLGYTEGFKVTLHPERLGAPLNHKKGAKVFVNSMGDLFHEDVPFSFIKEVFLLMGYANQHTYQILTKRPERMREFILWFMDKIPAIEGEKRRFEDWSKNIWLGVTAENQEQADKRIPILLDTPAAIRFVSIEPMLGEIDIEPFLSQHCGVCGCINAGGAIAIKGNGTYWCIECDTSHFDKKLHNPLDWVIVGGETGANARPMDAVWAQNIQKQCEAAKVPFFFKQWGEFIDEKQITNREKQMHGQTYSRWSNGDLTFYKCGKERAGHLLDGKEYREYPSES